ncbi:MAG TPA: 50S ribosomal protein L23 [Candidatus Kapabacteria bacterium]|nr:50S ribosomal protein L23 [Candidatus Kapabacteria bacterium]
MNIIIRKPLLTEKATLASEKGIYSFEVSADANKIQIADAVEKQFNVKVDEVRTMWMPLRSRSQFTRRGVVRGAKSRRKKAVVSLQPGFTIDVFTPMDVKAE